MARTQPDRTAARSIDLTLRENDEIFRLLVESVEDYAIFLLDPRGYIQTWNRGAARLKGYSEDDILGRHFSTFYTDTDRARRHPEHELEVASREGRYEEEGWRVRKDGTLFWANVILTSLRRNNELIGFAKVTRDLTERKRAEVEREKLIVQERRAREVAEEASRAKADFLGVMSHELRTPLNAIAGYADLILQGIPEPVGEGPRRQVERMKAAANYQLQLVEEILEFSRLESGDATTIREEVDLSEVGREVMEMFEQSADRQNLSTRLDVPTEPVVVRTDRAKVCKILKALLSNALKFTRDGEILLEMEVQGKEVLLHVRDEGIGISEEDQEKIFDSFWQAEQSNVREAEGMGLGLAICRRLARLLGGEVEVESEPGQGSTFTLRLPLATSGNDSFQTVGT